MTNENSKKFTDALHATITFAMDKSLQEKWTDNNQEIRYINDEFEEMADTILNIKTLTDYYNKNTLYDDHKLEYALTNNINTLDPTQLTDTELLTLWTKINNEKQTRNLETTKITIEDTIQDQQDEIGKLNITITTNTKTKQYLNNIPKTINASIHQITNDTPQEHTQIQGYGQGKYITINIDGGKQ